MNSYVGTIGHKATREQKTRKMDTYLFGLMRARSRFHGTLKETRGISLVGTIGHVGIKPANEQTKRQLSCISWPRTRAHVHPDLFIVTQNAHDNMEF